MALSAQLGTAGLVPDKISTTAVVSFEKLEAGWTITESHLEVNATIPGASLETFTKLAQEAKDNCHLTGNNRRGFVLL